MKTLFHPKWFSYNEKAAKLDEEVHKAIEPIVEKWIDAGYSPREIESIMFSTMSMIICFKHMKKNNEIIRAERAKKET